MSGALAFQLLSDEEKEFALNTTVQYAPRAFEWMLDCKATDDGLTIAKKGGEKSFDELPEWSWDKVQSFPVRNAHLPPLRQEWAIWPANLLDLAVFRWYGEIMQTASPTCKWSDAPSTSFILRTPRPGRSP